jgi:hypothetical protein
LELFFRSAGMEALLLGATTASNAPLPGMPLPGLPLPGLPLPGAPTTGAPTPLPPLPAPWHSADLDQDGQLSRSELAHWLRQLDSGLVRWAGPILDKRDANRDQKLQATELGLPPGSPKPATAQPNRPKT